MYIKDFIQLDIDQWSQLGHPALLQRFVMRNGVEFAGAKRPKGWKKRTKKMCYKNALEASMEHGLEYCEGYVLHRDISMLIQHAWNVLDGQALDLTLKDPEEYEYMGKVFPLSTVSAQVRKSGAYGVYGHDWIDIHFLHEQDPGLVQEVITAIPKMRTILERKLQLPAKID